MADNPVFVRQFFTEPMQKLKAPHSDFATRSCCALLGDVIAARITMTGKLCYVAVTARFVLGFKANFRRFAGICFAVPTDSPKSGVPLRLMAF